MQRNGIIFGVSAVAVLAALLLAFLLDEEGVERPSRPARGWQPQAAADDRQSEMGVTTQAATSERVRAPTDAGARTVLRVKVVDEAKLPVRGGFVRALHDDGPGVATDHAGVAVVTCAPGAVLRAGGDGFATRRFSRPDDAESVEVMLSPLFRLQVFVRDVDGAPMPGLDLFLYESSGDPEEEELFAFRTDGNGVGHPEVPRGSYFVECRDDTACVLGIDPVFAMRKLAVPCPAPTATVTVGRPWVACVRVVGDEVLGGSAWGFGPSLLGMTPTCRKKLDAIRGRLTRFGSAPEVFTAVWLPSAQNPAQSAAGLRVSLYLRHSGWFAAPLEARPYVEGLEPEEVAVPVGTSDMACRVRAVVDAGPDREPVGLPLVLAIAERGRPLLSFPLASIGERLLPPGGYRLATPSDDYVLSLAEVEPSGGIDLTPGSDTVVKVHFREPIRRFNTQVSVRHAGRAWSYAGMLHFTDGRAFQGSVPVANGVASLWLPEAAEIQWTGVVRDDDMNIAVEARGPVAGDGNQLEVVLR